MPIRTLGCGPPSAPSSQTHERPRRREPPVSGQISPKGIILHRASVERELHVWCRIRGSTIDPTTSARRFETTTTVAETIATPSITE
jgi:hypothetical protein